MLNPIKKIKMKAFAGWEKGKHHLWPLLVQKVAEGKLYGLQISSKGNY